MSITIQLSPDLEKRLKEKAKQEGIHLGHLIGRVLENRFPPSPPAKNSASKKEAELLQKINEGFPQAFWEEYFALVEKRRSGKLSPAEHTTLIGISGQLEKANARRMKYLVELANLKNADLDDLIDSLGIQPRSHA